MALRQLHAIYRSAYVTFAHALLADLEKETVDFVPNYDGFRNIACCSACPCPSSSGQWFISIAVGMATNIPPHIFPRLSLACIALTENPI